MRVISISVIRSSYGCDVALLEIAAPNPVYPFTGNATVKMDLARGTAKAYFADNFPDIPIKVVSDI